METEFRFWYGPIEVGISVEGDEDYSDVFGSVLESLDEIEGENDLSKLDQPPQSSTVDEITASQTSQEEVGNDGNTEQASLSGLQSADSDIESAARQCHVDSGDLMELVDIDPEREHLPFLIIDSGGIGSTQTERQLRTSLALLYIFKTCYDEDSVSSSDLKDALEMSGVPSDSMSNMYRDDHGDQLFDRAGRGGSATIGLTRPGLREAKNVINNLVEGEYDDSTE